MFVGMASFSKEMFFQDFELVVLILLFQLMIALNIRDFVRLRSREKLLFPLSFQFHILEATFSISNS